MRTVSHISKRLRTQAVGDAAYSDIVFPPSQTIAIRLPHIMHQTTPVANSGCKACLAEIKSSLSCLIESNVTGDTAPRGPAVAHASRTASAALRAL